MHGMSWDKSALLSTVCRWREFPMQFHHNKRHSWWTLCERAMCFLRISSKIPQVMTIITIQICAGCIQNVYTSTRSKFPFQIVLAASNLQYWHTANRCQTRQPLNIIGDTDALKDRNRHTGHAFPIRQAEVWRGPVLVEDPLSSISVQTQPLEMLVERI